MTDARKTRGLSAAPNAAARMQELLRENARENTELPVPEASEPSPAYSNTQISKQVSKEPVKDAVTPTVEEAPPSVTPPAPESPGPGLHDRIKSRLSVRDGKEPTVRLSIDVSERLHERIKVYCATNRIPTTRALVVALIEDLLDNTEV